MTNIMIDSDVNVSSSKSVSMTKKILQSKKIVKESSLSNISKNKKSTSIYQNTKTTVNEFDTKDGTHETINPTKNKNNNSYKKEFMSNIEVAHTNLSRMKKLNSTLFGRTNLKII